MKVRTLQSLTTPRGEIPAGKIITIPEHLAERLKGKIEPVTDLHPFMGAVEIIIPNDKRVWLATTPEAVKLIPQGAVFFLGDEILELQKAGKETARAALMVKSIFHGAKVAEVETYPERSQVN